MKRFRSLLYPLMLLSLSSAASELDTAHLQAAFPDLVIESVQPAAVEPWLELVLADGQVVYAEPEGRHLMVGSLIDLASRRNLTESTRESLRRDLLAERMPEGLFEFPADAGSGDWVTVVTDIDCPYCRRLHQQMADYHEQGINVRYLMLPRAGRGSSSWLKAVSAACASDPMAALTLAMNGTDPAPASCEHSIDEQFDLARRLNITGTPTIIDGRGRMTASYVPPARLRQELDRD